MLRLTVHEDPQVVGSRMEDPHVMRISMENPSVMRTGTEGPQTMGIDMVCPPAVGNGISGQGGSRFYNHGCHPPTMAERDIKENMEGGLRFHNR